MRTTRAQHLLRSAAMAIALAHAACGDAEAGAEVDAGETCRSTGGSWTSVDALVSVGAFMNAWGPSPDEVYISGGQPDAGVLYRYDGGNWAPVDVPPGPMLYWVHGTEGHLFVVGAGGRSLHRSPDGVWETLPTPTEVPLWGVWAASPTDVWAVGGDAAVRENPHPTLLHFDGASWVDVPLPTLDRVSLALFKVWGFEANDVHAVGSRGLALHYDGTNWTQVSTGTSDDFVSLWGRSADDVVAVGGRANGMVSRWEGSGWSGEVLAGVPGLNGVWMGCDGVAHADGVRSAIITVPAGALTPERDDFGSPAVLHGMFGFDGGPRFAVGGSLMSSPPYTGLVLVSR